MKRVFFFCLLVILAFPVQGEDFRIRGIYETPDGQVFEQLWSVKDKDTKITLLQGEMVRAELELKDGKAVRLLIMKRHAGKLVPFVVTGERRIRRELDGGYFPFRAALSFRDSEVSSVKMGSSRFVRLKTDMASSEE